MVINPEKAFVFLAVPRTASVSMTQALMTLEGSFRQGKDRHLMRVPSEYQELFRFCCVRNPYSRLCSHWAKVRQQNGFKSTFSEFLDRFTVHRQRAEKPMGAWLGGNRLDQVLRFEHLDEDWPTLPFIGELKLPTHNVSGVKWKDEYNEELAERVFAWCHKDFERFGYDKESWR